MGEIDDLASRVSNGVRGIKDALQEIDNAVTELSTMSDANTQNAKTMEDGLGRFAV
jgi:methyl-accepting chemotaxis protein